MAGALDVFGNKGGGDELIKNEEGLRRHRARPGLQAERLDVPALDAARGRQPRHPDRHAAGLALHARPGHEQARPGLREGAARVAVPGPQLLPHGRRHGLRLQGQPVHRHRRHQLVRQRGRLLGQRRRAVPNHKGRDPVGVGYDDARRTAGNTNDLNGKILRIHPEPDGTYTIPGGQPVRRGRRGRRRHAARST